MMRPLLASLALLALVAPTASAGPAAEGAASGWRALVTIDSGLADPDRRFEAFDAASLNLFDFDKDGADEIVSFNDNNVAYVLDADGDVLAELETTHPGGTSWAARDINPITIADLEGDGTPCLVVPNSAAYVTAFCYRGKALFGGLDFERVWEVRVDVAQWHDDFAETHPWIGEDAQPGLDGNAYASDVDGDGRAEVFVETDGYPGQVSLSPDGAHRWSTTHWDGNAGAQVADLDKDGRKEVVFATDAGIVAVYDAKGGALEWTFDARKHGVTPGSIPVGPLIADLAGDGRLELVLSARQAVDDGPGWQDRAHASWFALDAQGKVLWRVSEPWMNPLAYDHPAAVDVDGDGDLDVVALDWNTVGHKPGNWETTSRPSNLFALDGRTGRTLWHVGVPVYWSNKDFVVADLPGGKGAEIVLNENRHGVDGLGVRELATGKAIGWFPLEGWEAMRGPVAGDVDGDGRLDLVVPLGRKDPSPNYRDLDVGHREGAILVVATGASAKVLWSANFLQTDAPPAGEVKGLLAGYSTIPGPGLAFVLAAAASSCVVRAMRRR